jgi:hypothetical protein
MQNDGAATQSARVVRSLMAMARQPSLLFARDAILGALVAAAAAGGCATFDPPATPPPGTFSADVRLPDEGATWVVKETEFNEHTAKTRSQTITWTAMGDAVHGGTPVVRLSDGARVQARDRATGSLVALLDRDATELVRHAPHEGDFAPPLWVGKSWVARSTSTSRLSGRTLYDVVVVWTVAAYEDVRVPAGVFKAFRLEAWTDARDAVRKRTLWYAPSVPLVVKEVTEGLGAPPKLGVGRDRITVTTELVQFAPPAPPKPEPPAMPTAAEAAASGVGALVEVLTRHPEIRQRVEAAELLGHRLARSSGVLGALPALRAALDDTAAALRAAAGRALLAIAIAQADPMPALVLAAPDRDATQRLEAMRTLGELGRAAAGALPVVIERITTDADDRVRVAAAATARRIGLVPGDLAGLAPLLDDPLPALRTELTTALTGRVPETLAALGPWTRDASPEVRRRATVALGALGRLAPVDVLQPLADALDDPDAGVRAIAVRRLAGVGEPAFRILRAALRHLDPDVRSGAARSIVAIPSRQSHAIAALIEVLSDPDAGVRASAVRTLGALGPAAGDASAELRARMARETSSEVRALMEQALGTIAPR